MSLIPLSPQTSKSPPTPQAGNAPARLLQRTCACGGTPGPSGECGECRRKRLGVQSGSLQAKLAVNQPGDRWEQEADRMAEAVTGAGPAHSGPVTKPPLSPLMRKPAADPAPGELPASVDSVLRSPGRPLEAGTRSFMETRFGYDFGRVRIHSDAPAARSARQVNALAYTVGQDVVFGAGQYVPATPAGRKLLAHELAHTLQQESGMPPIRRATGPFTVDGLYEKRAGEPDYVFFDRGSPDPTVKEPESVLDSVEDDKIKKVAKTALDSDEKEITLYGFASEEGDPAYNQTLASRRMSAVRNVLHREKFKPPDRAIHSILKASCSSNKVDYRMWRAVEMRHGKGASQRVCNYAEPTACSPDRLKDLADARDRALKFIDGATGAIARLDKFIQTPADEPAVSAALDTFFDNSHTPKTAQAVRDRVQGLRDFLSHIADSSGKVTVVCGTAEERTCNAGGAASTNNKSQSVIFCPMFFDDPAVKVKQEEILIHESSHGSKFATDDRAYQSERVILILTTDQALANAQSISQFVMHLQGKSRPRGPAIADKVSGCSDANRETVQKAMAWAQRWNTWAKFGTAQTYGSPNNTAAMAPFIIQHFGRADKAAIAGIYDRYRAMDDWFDLFFNLRCVPASDPSCSATNPVNWTLTHSVSPSGGGPSPDAAPPASTGGQASSGETATPTPSGSSPSTTPLPTPITLPTPAAAAANITVCPTFFTLGTLEQQVIEMYAGLAVRMPGVTESQSRAYPKLAYDYKVHYWNVK